MGGFFVVGIMTSPNNLDSLATHFCESITGLQHGSLESWPASTQFQLYYPVNAHFQGTWLFLFGGSEKLFFLVQWFSYLIILILTYEIGIFLGSRRVVAMFCALLCLGFRWRCLQTYSFQGDLTVAALILAGIYFLFTYRYVGEPKLLFSAMLSLALAMGTKQTAYFTLPVLIGFGILLVEGYRAENQKMGRCRRNHRDDRALFGEQEYPEHPGDRQGLRAGSRRILSKMIRFGNGSAKLIAQFPEIHLQPDQL